MKVVLLGSGNVATHLGQALRQAGNTILQVWSRKPENAQLLASVLQAQAISEPGDIDLTADIYIISVSDEAIRELARKLPLKDQLVVHTSGTSDLHVLEGVSARTGVFYPLQTFSKQKAVDFSSIPIAVEGSSEEVTRSLLAFAGQISRQVMALSSERRKALHVAAVFACNFSNHLYTLAKDVLQQNQLEFSLLRPLIAETAAKVQEFLPDEVQTGPAIRNDESTIRKHREFLKNAPQLLELYDKLTESIIDHYKAC